MARPSLHSIAAILVAALTLAACAKQSSTQESTRTVTLANPSDFPLYPGSTLIDVGPIDYGPMFAMIRKNDPKAKLGANYRGHEIIVSTAASIPQLKGWIAQLKHAPPTGFHVTHSSGGFTFDSGHASSSEVNALFETVNGKRAVFVIAIDPKQIRERLGPALDVVDKYTALPPMLRGPIDDQMKQQIGYTVSEMLDRHSPVGMVFATLKTMANTDRRAIVLVDETKAT